MAGEPLYMRILGREFDRLPPVLRRFHASPSGARGSGVVEVRAGRGPLRRVMAALAGLPQRGRNVRVEVEVQVLGEKEIWRRSFNGRPLETIQWEEDGFLMERAGPVTFRFRLRADGRSMLFDHVDTRVMGIPVGSALALKVDARATGEGDGWNLEVKVSAPLLGMITSYTGHIAPIS